MYFIEDLNFNSFLNYLFLKNKINKKKIIYYLYKNKFSFYLINIIAKLFQLKLIEFNFFLVNIREKNGFELFWVMKFHH